MNAGQIGSYSTVALLIAGCSDAVPIPPPLVGDGGGGSSGCAAGETLAEGDCRPAGVQPDGCPAGESWQGNRCVAAGLGELACPPGTLLDGRECRPAGVASCGAGFTMDDAGGCEAILPTAPCADGMMATPGDEACRPVADCGSDPYAGIPIASTTQFVDAAYGGADSDGSQAKPWTNLADAIAAAAPEAIVAVAAGDYVGDLVVADPPVTIWGRCPELVQLAGVSPHGPAVNVVASGTILRRVAITGPGSGVLVSQADGVVMDQLRIHHTNGVGIQADGAELTLSASLVDHTAEGGLQLLGSTAEVTESAIVDVAPPADLGTARGIAVRPLADQPSTLSAAGIVIERVPGVGAQVLGSSAIFERAVMREMLPRAADDALGRGCEVAGEEGLPATLTLLHTVIRDNLEVGLTIFGADVVMEDSVIAETAPRASTGTTGYGIAAFNGAAPASLELRRSVLADNHELGLTAEGADLEIVSSIVRDTLVAADPEGGGVGINLLRGDDGRRGWLSLQGSVVENSRIYAVGVSDSDAIIEQTLIRDTLPSAGLRRAGRGIELSAATAVDGPSTLVLRASLLERNHDVGLFCAGAEAEVEDTVIRDTRPSPADDERGRGINAVRDEDSGYPSSLTLRRSLIDQATETGVAVHGSEATIEASVITATRPRASDLTFGRGLAVTSHLEEPSFVSLSGSRIADNHDLGISLQGSAITIDGVLVHDTLPRASDGRFGRGVNLQASPLAQVIRWSRIEKNRDMGLYAWATSVDIAATVVADTEPRELDALFGDGVVVDQAEATLTGARIANNERAGVASFAARLTLTGSALTCNGVDLNGEMVGSQPFELIDGGGNRCGCDATEVCKLVSASLSAPEPAADPAAD